MNIEMQFTSVSALRAYGQSDLYGSADAAAFDLRAMIEAPVSILPGEQVMIGTGIKLNIGGGAYGNLKYAGIALPRSGRGSKEGLCIANTAGLIDQDYLGEIMLCCWARPTSGHINLPNARIGGSPIHIEPGERIAQLMIIPVIRPVFSVVDEFSTKTLRGDGGFGSSGL